MIPTQEFDIQDIDGLTIGAANAPEATLDINNVFCICHGRTFDERGERNKKRDRKTPAPSGAIVPKHGLELVGAGLLYTAK